jgi:hypothetical protein
MVLVKGENLKIPIFQVYVDTVGDAEKYRIKLSERFPAIKFVVAKKADSLFPVVSGASIVAKVVNLYRPLLNLSFIQPCRSQEIEPCGNGCLMKQQTTCIRTLVLDTPEVKSASFSF